MGKIYLFHKGDEFEYFMAISTQNIGFILVLLRVRSECAFPFANPLVSCSKKQGP